MDPQQLCNVLMHTFSPDATQRAQAEAAIKTLPSIPGAPAALLQVVGAADQVQKEVRLAAAISFKNITKKHWAPPHTVDLVQETEKPALRELVFQVMLVESDSPIRKMLAEAVNQIARTDYPAQWPQLLPEVLSHVHSGEPLRIHNSLLALRQVTKRLEYKRGDDRAPLEMIVNTALPIMLQLMKQLLESNNNTLEAAMIMKMALKILWSCTQFSL
eukprot:CAMPEP_0119521810 /NCGR_PEP_ID=MMETSP1344-20130328/37389_1 /TAXON_ID=236787 /ORGANISM="Florenciella parvula, Strain CCMP2471" /LENGTH=215 /DNA_ID=CAMNT_0007559817 /DNA_START=32 /DNA_END=676 /DNA_ORIENTATION=-